MLQSLSIRNVILISKLDLTLDGGMTVLTGETGAGKSILLDALSLALGERANTSYIKPGADQASVTASFTISTDSYVYNLLEEQGIEQEDSLVLRRVINSDGKSKAFINDQAVSINFLSEVGEKLIEIHGQFDQLLKADTHLDYIDAFAGLTKDVEKVKALYAVWKNKEKFLKETETLQAQNTQNCEFLKYALEELSRVEPNKGEEQKLIEEREFLQNRAKIIEAVSSAMELLTHENGAEHFFAASYKQIEKAAVLAPHKFENLMGSFERIHVELSEVSSCLEAFLQEDDESLGKLQSIEDRLFMLRSLARKHGKTVDELADLQEELQEKLKLIEGGEDSLKVLKEELEVARVEYFDAATILSQKRSKAIKEIDISVNNELPPLKLEKALFKTALEILNENDWGPKGIEHIEFLIQTNPGMPFGSISRIASGGERNRFMLALKVVLAHAGYVTALIFDEIDSGIGGAVASAVGERLRKLSNNLQIIAITHSPQVASYAQHHLHIEKGSLGEEVIIRVDRLDMIMRQEEVARMLAGETITNEARAAAATLLKVGA